MNKTIVQSHRNKMRAYTFPKIKDIRYTLDEIRKDVGDDEMLAQMIYEVQEYNFNRSIKCNNLTF